MILETKIFSLPPSYLLESQTLSIYPYVMLQPMSGLEDFRS
jgi:hypothetical protein